MAIVVPVGLALRGEWVLLGAYVGVIVIGTAVWAIREAREERRRHEFR